MTEKQIRVLIFGGTSEGRELAEYARVHQLICHMEQIISIRATKLICKKLHLKTNII